MNIPTITFIPITKSAEKLQIICQIAYDQFVSKESLLIVVPSEKAAEYVDALLWRMPLESFLPHVYSNETSDEQCVISTNPGNVNKAATLLNLCQEPNPFFSDFNLIYEFLDQTTPENLKISEKKKDFYDQAIRAIVA